MVSSSSSEEKLLKSFGFSARTSLNAAFGMLGFLRTSGLNEEQTALLDVLGTNLNNLLKVVTDLLIFTKLDELSLNEESFKVQDLLRELQRNYTEVCHEKEIKLITNQAETNLLTDRMLIKQLMANLLELAIGVSGAGAEIELSFEFTSDPVFKITSSSSKGFTNEAPVLLLINKIAAALRGNLDISNYSGNRLEIKFSAPVALKEQAEEEFSHRLDNLRILLAEDDRISQKIMVSILEKLGAQLVIVENGMDAIDHIHNHDFNLVLMDIEMPVLGGIEATQVIKGFSQVPVIALTAHALNNERDRFLEAGMDGYLPKPISKDLLIKELSKLGL